MEIKGINHATFSVANLEKSIQFYENVFDAKLLVRNENLAYFDLAGLWIALNVEKNIPRQEIHESYTHMAFSITDEDFGEAVDRLERLGVNMLPGRKRGEKECQSVYFTDPDGHKFEFHTGGLEDRLDYYKKKTGMTFY